MTLQYWYLLPAAIVLGTIATGSGIGGATFFAPLFILALGIQPEVAIGTALITEVFGFASGLSVYARRRLIDYGLGTALLVTTIPMALVGVLISELIEPDILKGILGVGLFAVAANSLRRPERKTVDRMDAAIEQGYGSGKGETCLVTAEGQQMCYTVRNRTEGRLIAAVGALFKGMIATGLGELDEHFFRETLSCAECGFGSDRCVRGVVYRPVRCGWPFCQVCPRRCSRVDNCARSRYLHYSRGHLGRTSGTMDGQPLPAARSRAWAAHSAVAGRRPDLGRRDNILTAGSGKGA
jgi:uncharacterized membrane protein YfcA